MASNLRSVVAQCYRLGGSRQTRNFSSSPGVPVPDPKELRARAKALAICGLKSIKFKHWVATGFLGYYSYELVELLKFNRRAKKSYGEFKIRERVHKERVAKAKAKREQRGQ